MNSSNRKNPSSAKQESANPAGPYLKKYNMPGQRFFFICKKQRLGLLLRAGIIGISRRQQMALLNYPPMLLLPCLVNKMASAGVAKMLLKRK